MMASARKLVRWNVFELFDFFRPPCGAMSGERALFLCNIYRVPASKQKCCEKLKRSFLLEAPEHDFLSELSMTSM